MRNRHDSGRIRASQACQTGNVRTDENGVSHQNRCELSNSEREHIAGRIAPSGVDRAGDPLPNTWSFWTCPRAGWASGMITRKPQWIGRYRGGGSWRPMDGKRVEMGPGELSFGNDQNTKADAQGRRGRTDRGQWADQPCVTMMVQVDREAVNSRPCQLK